MTSEVSCAPAGVTKALTRILAYLGELHADEWVAAKQLCDHLNLRFTTAKNALAAAEERGWIEKKISNRPRVIASFRIHPGAGVVRVDEKTGETTMKKFIPPEWKDEYGKHPHSV